MGALEGDIPMSTLLEVASSEAMVMEQAVAPEITPIDPVAAQQIGSILCNKEQVYQSFRVPDVISPTDLQQKRIAELQEQRVDLLRSLHLGDVAEAMRDPQIYFEGITLQFFEECGKGRREYSRAKYIDSHTIAEQAHTGTFRRDKLGTIEPEMLARIGFRSREDDGIVSSDLSFFKVETDLQNTKPGYKYQFVSDSRGELEIFLLPKETFGTTEKPQAITDPVDRFTLLQALTVDMRSALGNLRHYEDARVKKILCQYVHGSRRRNV